jgi:hypothetical protein
VLASLAEPFGLVLTEARKAGLAIVATRVGGIPEALDGGRPERSCPRAIPKRSPMRYDFCGIKYNCREQRAREPKFRVAVGQENGPRNTRVYQDLVTHRPQIEKVENVCTSDNRGRRLIRR